MLKFKPPSVQTFKAFSVFCSFLFCFVLFCFNSCHNDRGATIFQMRMRECLYHHHPDFLKFMKSLTEINTSLVMKCDHQRLEDFF